MRNLLGLCGLFIPSSVVTERCELFVDQHHQRSADRTIAVLLVRTDLTIVEPSGLTVACASKTASLEISRLTASDTALPTPDGTSVTASAIKDYLDMEQRWLSLARSYEFTERLS